MAGFPKITRFTPKNKGKYIGKNPVILARSSWERQVMHWLDMHPQVIKWSSEETVIPYRSPLDNKLHKYFPDFLVHIMEAEVEVVYLVEVKPKSQTQAPKMKKRLGKPTKTYVRGVTTYLVNDAKFEAAEAYCLMKNWKFKILTEDNLHTL